MRARMARYKDLAFEHPDSGLMVELHWRLFQNPYLLRGDDLDAREPMQLVPGASVAGSASRWASSRGSAPRPRSHSARNAGSPSGSRASARSTSSEITFPEPSQMPLSGASRSSSPPASAGAL